MNRGHFKRYYELSRTTRYRIRRAQEGLQDDSSSSEDDLPVPVPKRQRLQGRQRDAIPNRDEAENINNRALVASEEEEPQVNPIDIDVRGGDSDHQNADNGDQAEDCNALHSGGSGAEEAERVQAEHNIQADNQNDASDRERNDNVDSGSERLSDNANEVSGLSSDPEQDRALEGDRGESDDQNVNGTDTDSDSGSDSTVNSHSGREESGAEDHQGSGNESEPDAYAEYEDPGWHLDDENPLYEGAPIRVGESMLAMLSFALRYNLSGACVSDLLTLVAMHCKPEGNRCRKTLFKFKKFFENINYPIKKRYYCSACHSNIENENENCAECRQDYGKSFFIEVPILSQLQSLYKRPGFRDSLQRRFTRRKQNDTHYEDIYDGSVYKELSSGGGILSNPNNISLMWYTDGVSIFKSAKYEIWPFYLTINELPYNKRTVLPNSLLAGLWFGKIKPVVNTFLNYMRHDLGRLRRGIQCKTAVRNQEIVVRGIVIGGTCDLPAKASFLNFKNYNGRFGCPRCLIETTHLGRGVNVYPSGAVIRLRTDEETLRQAGEAIQLPLYQGEKQDVMGVKGPTALSTFVYQCVQTTAVDSMHCLFLGIVRSLLFFWFDPSHNLQPFSLRESMAIIEHRLKLITPPSFVKRLPRSLKEIKYWKAYELKLFLFYYSIPILKGIMSDIYFDHHVLLVHATFLLCQASVSPDMVQLADDMLREYVSQYELLYGLENMTCNVHSLQHLAETVRNFGPLWVTSCFPYEDLNGKLKKLVTGPRYAELQVCTGIAMFFKLTELKQNLGRGEVSQFCDRLTNRHHKYKKTRIVDSMWILGTYRRINVLEGVRLEAVTASNIEGTNFYSFQRLLKYNIIFSSELYERAARTDSKCVKYLEDNRESIGIVHSYFRVTNCQCAIYCDDCDAKYYAIVRKCVTRLVPSSWPDATLHFMHKLVRMGRVTAVELNSIQNICFVTKITDINQTYIVEAVNLIEPE